MPSQARVIIDGVRKQGHKMNCRESFIGAVTKAALLAVGTLMTWSKEDLEHHYGVTAFDRARCYGLAVAVGNMSYIKAYESYHKMKPYLANDVQPSDSMGYTHVVSSRKRDRLVIGSRVLLPETYCKPRRYAQVTSLDVDRVVLTVRERKPNGGMKAAKVIKLDHEKCAAMFPAPKAPKRKKVSDSECETAEGSAHA